MQNTLKDMVKKVEEGLLPQKELANERIKVCEECPSFKMMLRQCGECFCFMDLKTKILRAQCPLGKW